ncbi:MAG: arylesterase [Gammaproteobacteria bacterium]|nr:arylesterase [Gammaproteobacteria bacterium]
MKGFPNWRHVAAALLLLLAACSAPPTLPRLPAGAVVLAFGDSLTYGTGADSGQSYPAVLTALAGWRVINAGVPGEVSAEGLARLPGVLDEYRPQLLILIHGGNDLLRKGSAQELARNLRAMVEAARSRGIAVVLVGVPAPGLVLGVPELYATLAEEQRLPYDAEALRTILGDRALKSDPIHPNAEGYRQLAQRLHALLRAAGAL